MNIAKIFMSGRSQAVRLPKEFWFDGSEVRIRCRGRVVILEPIPDDWAWLDAFAGPVDDDFVRATETLRSLETSPSRAELDIVK